MLTPAELEAASMLFDGMMKRLEESVMQDIVRRIRINGEITRSADWQMHRLYELGESRRELSRLIKDGLQIDDEKLTDMFRDIICSGYARDDKLYKMTGKLRLPFAENAGLQQYISAVAQQTGSTMKNLSQSMGFSVNVGGRVQFQPAATYYQNTLDNAVNGIATGAFDYNTVLKRTVKEMTDSGLRTVDYASGHVDRVDVAARRAVMTGLTQITAKVNDDNAKALETDTFEISWHSGARPSHQVWQGRWYTEKELTTVCGLGSVTGLCGANCYHSYYPVIPGVSVPTYTEAELDEMNRRENEPVEYNGREYTKYEATQRQRYLERKMRAERQEIKLLQDGGADENDLIAARCRYRQTSQTYKDFSKAMELPEQRQRVTIDGLGNIGQGKWKNPSKPVAKSGGSGIIDTNQKFKKFTDGNEANDFFYYDDEKRGLFAKRNSQHGQWLRTLSDDEKECILDYAASGYGDINDYWRKKEGWEYINAELVKEKSRHLDAAISRYTLKENIVVQRGTTESALDQLFKEYETPDDYSGWIGKKYVEQGYMSTTVLQNNPVALRKPVVFNIQVPAGKGVGAYINEPSLTGFNDNEYEFLIKRNATFTIMGVKEDITTGAFIVDMRLDI